MLLELPAGEELIVDLELLVDGDNDRDRSEDEDGLKLGLLEFESRLDELEFSLPTAGVLLTGGEGRSDLDRMLCELLSTGLCPGEVLEILER